MARDLLIRQVEVIDRRVKNRIDICFVRGLLFATGNAYKSVASDSSQSDPLDPTTTITTRLSLFDSPVVVSPKDPFVLTLEMC